MRAKARRARDPNDGIIPAERLTLSRTARSDHTEEEASQQNEVSESPVKNRSLEGDQVRLFMEKVKPGL